MGTPSQSGALQRSFSANLEMLTRATSAILVFLYGVGFIILAVHDARYGIVQFGLLRARILLVGFLFAALVMLSVGLCTIDLVTSPR